MVAGGEALMTGRDQGRDEGRPVLRVIRGDATPEEIAALLAVVTARSAATAEPEPSTAPPAWLDRAGRMRQPLPPGPGAWRASVWPR
jgi:hypothetical protein